MGTAASLSVAENGSQTVAELSFDTQINPKALMGFNQIVKGTLRTVSVGFVPHTMEYEDDTPILKDNELLEISVVPIPANPRAIALAFKDGSITTKDAKWLHDSMVKEAAELQKQLDTTKQEKSMTDESAQALIASVAKLIETVEAQNAKTVDLEGRLPELETEEQKTEREAQEAADAKAAKEAENVAAGLNHDGSAKSGTEGDHGGAEDELDEDAELTPEQTAELDEQLAQQPAEVDQASLAPHPITNLVPPKEVYDSYGKEKADDGSRRR